MDIDINSTPSELKDYLRNEKGYTDISALSKLTGLTELVLNKVLSGSKPPSYFIINKFRNLERRIANTKNNVDDLINDLNKDDVIGFRISKIQELTGKSIKELSKTVGISESILYSIRTGKLKMSETYVKRICEIYPSLNPEWIMYGELPILTAN